MAGWISSKLKVAENLLHQIDQQAADSLGKTEKKQTDDGLDFTTSPSKPSHTLPLRHQLKKKMQTQTQTQTQTPESSNNNRIVAARDSPKQQGKEVVESVAIINDSDWTELLSSPKLLSPSTRCVNGVKEVGKNVKGSGRAVGGTVRRGVEGSGRKRSDRRESESVSGVLSDGKIPEYGNSEGKKEVDRERGGDELLQSMKVVADAELPFVAKNADLVGGPTKAVIAHTSSNDRGEVGDDGKIRKGSSIAGMKDVKGGSRSESSNESDSDSESGSTTDSEIEREREERIQKRREILAAKAAQKAANAIKEQENLVARVEGEKQSLEKILEERARQAAQEASELQSAMMEMMEATEVEKQKHNHTRMEVLARLAKLETANADLAKSLAVTQRNLEMEVNWVAELLQQVEAREVVHEEFNREISSAHQSKKSLTNVVPSKGTELETKMLEAEYSFLSDKFSGLQEKATNLEADIASTEKEIGNSTEVEIELKRRLRQLTDHLIHTQAQVESLSSDKAMLLFRIEAVSRLLDENKSLVSDGDLSASSREDVETGRWEASASVLRPLLEDKIKSGKQHLGSLLWQLDAVFSAGAVFLTRNRAAKLWSLGYLVCLHLWVLYILFAHSWSVDDATTSSNVLSLDTISNVNTG